MTSTKTKRLAKFVLAAIGGSTLLVSCDGPIATEFRNVASSGLQQGVTTIVTSFIDGVFAVVDPG